MNNRVLIFVIILVVFGAVVIIQQQKSQDQVDQKEIQAMQEVHKAEVGMAKQAAIDAARQAEAQAQAALQNTLDQARMAEVEVRKKADELQAKIVGLVSQAQALLDSGQFQQAIDLAKTILGEDPNNLNAQSIIDRATAKLAEAAQQQINAAIPEAQNALQEAIPALPNTP
jgi:tetratricopeptide (TPR) repeat protein